MPNVLSILEAIQDWWLFEDADDKRQVLAAHMTDKPTEADKLFDRLLQDPEVRAGYNERPREGYLPRIGSWLAAALNDMNVCPEMKDDIAAWFDADMPSPDKITAAAALLREAGHIVLIEGVDFIRQNGTGTRP